MNRPVHPNRELFLPVVTGNTAADFVQKEPASTGSLRKRGNLFTLSEVGFQVETRILRLSNKALFTLKGFSEKSRRTLSFNRGEWYIGMTNVVKKFLRGHLQANGMIL